MERKQNWLGWAALALGILALVVALGGRSGPGGRMMAYAVPAAPAAPAAPQAPEAPFGPRFERGDRGDRGPMAFHGQRDELRFMHERHADGMMMGRHGGPWMGIFGLFGLLKALGQLVALGMLAWLLLKLFNQRRNGPQPAAAGPDVPRTPAGHDPTVE